MAIKLQGQFLGTLGQNHSRVEQTRATGSFEPEQVALRDEHHDETDENPGGQPAGIV